MPRYMLWLLGFLLLGVGAVLLYFILFQPKPLSPVLVTPQGEQLLEQTVPDRFQPPPGYLPGKNLAPLGMPDALKNIQEIQEINRFNKQNK
jgi:hypothetical protein